MADSRNLIVPAANMMGAGNSFAATHRRIVFVLTVNNFAVSFTVKSLIASATGCLPFGWVSEV